MDCRSMGNLSQWILRSRHLLGKFPHKNRVWKNMKKRYHDESKFVPKANRVNAMEKMVLKEQ
jgi:hypothetical protein